ncbi:hypothetical protein ACP70R_017924 [Stipagrostis hirtigluma subsp. patula]
MACVSDSVFIYRDVAGGLHLGHGLMATTSSKLARDKAMSSLVGMLLSMVARFNAQEHCFAHGGAIFTGLMLSLGMLAVDEVGSLRYYS